MQTKMKNCPLTLWLVFNATKAKGCYNFLQSSPRIIAFWLLKFPLCHYDLENWNTQSIWSLKVPPYSAKAQSCSNFLQLSPKVFAIWTIIWLLLFLGPLKCLNVSIGFGCLVIVAIGSSMFCYFRNLINDSLLLGNYALFGHFKVAIEESLMFWWVQIV